MVRVPGQAAEAVCAGRLRRARSPARCQEVQSGQLAIQTCRGWRWQTARSAIGVFMCLYSLPPAV